MEEIMAVLNLSANEPYIAPTTTADSSALFPSAPVYARTDTKKSSGKSNLPLMIGLPVLAIAAGGLAWGLMGQPAQTPTTDTAPPTQVAEATPAPLAAEPAPMPTPAPVAETPAATPAPTQVARAETAPPPRVTTPAKRAAPARRAAPRTAPDAASASENVSANVPAPVAAPPAPPVVIAAPVAAAPAPAPAPTPAPAATPDAPM
jgi:Meckel syndrome type 1 protein